MPSRLTASFQRGGFSRVTIRAKRAIGDPARKRAPDNDRRKASTQQVACPSRCRRSAVAERGYHATSMRDLAAATSMTPGAIYFHVASKQQLLLAVYEEGVQRILDRVEAAMAAERGPWARL